MTDKKARPAPWTDAENSAICSLYFAMLRLAISGQSYNKAGMVRTAQGNPKPGDSDISGDNHVPGIFCQLSERSRPSIEMKLMNCSAIHRDISGPTTVTMDGFGYRAMPNYQSSLKVAMLTQIDAEVATLRELLA